jgi:predicted acetyltransferase
MTIDQLPTIDKNTLPAYMKIQIREAEPQDLTDIMNLYDEHNKQLQVYIARSRELWEIQEETKREYQGEFRTFLFEDKKRVIGYMRLTVNRTSKSPHGSTLRVIESSITTYDGAMRALQLIKTEAMKHEFYRVGVTGPSTNNLSRIVLDLGGRIRGGWKYQLRVPDILRFLHKISPVLEKRLVGSMFEGLTKDLTINTFRHCYLLKFTKGKVESVTDIGMQEVDESRGFRAPPNDLVRLIFGGYDIDEISHNNIDFIVGRDLKSLIDTLFPKGESCISYYYC